MSIFDKLFKKRENETFKFTDTSSFDNSAANAKLADEDTISLLRRYNEKLIDNNEFLCSLGKAEIFYSTPFGDHKDGDQRLFVLPAKDNTAYNPVFSSCETAKAFYERVGRVNFIIAQGTFKAFVETTDKTNKGKTPIKLGVIIEPAEFGITLNADMLETVINIMN